ncbi:hypothetical protein ACNKHV_11985 [Shigella flexneri]
MRRLATGIHHPFAVDLAKQKAQILRRVTGEVVVRRWWRLCGIADGCNF